MTDKWTHLIRRILTRKMLAAVGAVVISIGAFNMDPETWEAITTLLVSLGALLTEF